MCRELAGTQCGLWQPADLRFHRPSLRPPRRRRLPYPAKPWGGAMTVTEVSILFYVTMIVTLCFRGTLLLLPLTSMQLELPC